MPPRRPRAFFTAPTQCRRTKAFPLGGRWHGEAVTDEGRRAAAVTYEPETLAVDHHLRGHPVRYRVVGGKALSDSPDGEPPLPEGEARAACICKIVH